MTELSGRILDLLNRRKGRPHTVSDVANCLFGLREARANLARVNTVLTILSGRGVIQCDAHRKDGSIRLFQIAEGSDARR